MAVAKAAFVDLPREPNVLPCLTSFRLSCEFWDQEIRAPYLLCQRPSLRRLYVDVVLEIATVIEKLEHLRVLGFHAGHELHEAAALHLADQLSEARSPSARLAVL